MKKGVLHQKIAKALYALAIKKSMAEKFFENLKDLSLITQDKDLMEALDKVATLSETQIVEVITKSFGKQLAEEVLNMLVLLVMSHQVKLIVEIAQTYKKMYFAAEGISDLEIYSSRELTAEEKADLNKQLNKSHKSEVNFLVDQGLIGGLQIYENGMLTDYSVKNQLENLRRVLLGEHIV